MGDGLAVRVGWDWVANCWIGSFALRKATKTAVGTAEVFTGIDVISLQKDISQHGTDDHLG